MWLADAPGIDRVVTAALIAALDLVVTIDTGVAHCAGAIDAPMWVMAMKTPDWSWGPGERSPFYPATRLFRQSRPGCWAPVVAAVCAALSA